MLLGEGGILTSVLLGIGFTTSNPVAMVTLVVALLALVMGVFFNRQGKIILAGSIVVFFVDVAMVIFITTTPGGLSSFALPLLNVLV